MFATKINHAQYAALMGKLTTIESLLKKPTGGGNMVKKYKHRVERKNTICYHVRQLLNDGKPHTWRELRTQVAKLMDKNISKQSVNAFLSKLYQIGELDRVGHGIYQKKV